MEKLRRKWTSLAPVQAPGIEVKSGRHRGRNLDDLRGNQAEPMGEGRWQLHEPEQPTSHFRVGFQPECGQRGNPLALRNDRSPAESTHRLSSNCQRRVGSGQTAHQEYALTIIPGN